MEEPPWGVDLGEVSLENVAVSRDLYFDRDRLGVRLLLVVDESTIITRDGDGILIRIPKGADRLLEAMRDRRQTDERDKELAEAKLKEEATRSKQ